VLAQALLPIAFTAVLLAWDGWRPRTDDRTPPARVGPLLLISYLGVLSHVLLDYLNNYGVRLLAPLEWRWFYGDTLFIADVWLWLILGAGVLCAKAPSGDLGAAVAGRGVGLHSRDDRVGRSVPADRARQLGPGRGGAPESADGRSTADHAVLEGHHRGRR
jgi:hypothetical protein